MNDSNEWGLRACGNAGTVEVSLLSLNAMRDRWECELQFKRTYLRFKVDGENAIHVFWDFVTNYLGHQQFAEARVGDFGGQGVFIVKDDEESNRFFLHVRGGGAHLEYVIDKPESQHLLAALHLLIKDLD